MNSCTSGVRLAIAWLRFSIAIAAAMLSLSRLCHITSLVSVSPVLV